jgi:hypothetical protein
MRLEPDFRGSLKIRDSWNHVTEIPYQNTTHIKTREKVDNNNNKMRDKYANSKRVDAVVVAIQRGEFVHFFNAVKKYEYSREAVSRRVRGLTKSKKQADSFWRQCLSDEEEEVLI